MIDIGKLQEYYSQHSPYPSCLICGHTEDNKIIHVAMSDEGTASRIITAYFPSEEKWTIDMKTRKEKSE